MRWLQLYLRGLKKFVVDHEFIEVVLSPVEIDLYWGLIGIQCILQANIEIPVREKKTKQKNTWLILIPKELLHLKNDPSVMWFVSFFNVTQRKQIYRKKVFISVSIEAYKN